MALSKSHTCYHGFGEDASVRGNKRKQVENGGDGGGWRRMFHIKALSVISAQKNTEKEDDFRHFTLDARACVE